MNQREKQTGSASNDEIIQPVKFRPASPVELPRFRLPWAQLIVALVLVSAAWGAWYVFTARSITIATEPSDAIVAFDELLAPRIGDRWIVRPGSRKLRVTADGHYDFDGAITIGADPIQQHKITLKPLPGRLQVEVSPIANATINIDGKDVGQAPTTVENVESGPREILISAERYLPFETVLEIQGRGVTQSLRIELKPAWADLAIASQPQGATVTIDGEAVGTTPVTAEIMQGKRTIELNLSGYKKWRRSFDVIAGSPLEPPPVILAKADAFAEISTTPSGASISAGAEFKGQSPIRFALRPDKTYRITARKPGYRKAERSVSAKSGETHKLSLQLTPELAEVQVIATPKDAELLIDRKSYGSADRIIKLPTRPHDIEIRKSGYASYTATITPRKGVRKRIRVRLKTPAAASAPTSTSPSTQGTQRSGQASIKSFAGQELKLFRGGEITMGSSRRDPGRRANETLRNARLVRPFYLGTKEVTNGQYRRFLANHRLAPLNGVNVDGDTHPVVSISWDSAAVYCNWLSRKDALPVFYQIKNGKVLGINPASIGYRLPTEAEWSWVARTVPRDTNTFDYPWAGKFPPRGRSGNYADESASGFLGRVIANYNDGFPVTAPVGSFAASLRGISDLGGNVSEWINDHYSATPASEQGNDPLGPRRGEARVIRGSSWAHATQTELRLAYRDFDNEPRDDVGFRIARYAQ